MTRQALIAKLGKIAQANGFELKQEVGAFGVPTGLFRLEVKTAPVKRRVFEYTGDKWDDWKKV